MPVFFIMPWSVSNPPPPAKNWSQAEKRKCVKAANAILSEGGSEEDAIFACINAAGRSKKMDDQEVELKVEEKEVDTGERDKAQIAYMIPLGATSFSDIDEFVKAQEIQERVSELTRQFNDLSWNILHNDEIADKAVALRSLVDELDGRLGEALKEAKADKSVFGIIKEIITGKKKEVPDKPKEPSGLILWKEGDRYRFMAIHTNKYRDEDSPPEILAEASHERFMKEVESGVHPYPELWHWHTPGTKWGIADWLHYDKETGFMLASGFVDWGHEKEAEAIATFEEPVKTSHGMPAEFIERDKEDSTIITTYVSKEISDLPAHAAANQLTGFTIVKEVDDMSIPDEKKDYLKMVGLSDEAITQIEADLGSKAKTAEEAKLEFKESETEVAEPIEEPAEEPEGKVEEPTEPQFTTREEVAEAITEVVAPIAETVKTIAEIVQSLAKSDDKKISEKAVDTPAASIAALVMRNFRAVGSDKTKVDGDEGIEGPEEADHEKNITGIPFLDKMLSEE